MTVKLSKEQVMIATIIAISDAQTNQAAATSPASTDAKIEKARLQHLSTPPSPPKAAFSTQISQIKQPRPGF